MLLLMMMITLMVNVDDDEVRTVPTKPHMYTQYNFSSSKLTKNFKRFFNDNNSSSEPGNKK